MKKVSVLIPCFNEEDNVVPISEAVTKIFTTELTGYDYEIVFIDNDSTDKTRLLIRELCAKDDHIKAILNARNFGGIKSPYYGLMQTTGDCTVLLYCDFQEPVDMIPAMVREWELGSKIVVMQKTVSDENRIMYGIRSLYYKILKKFSDVPQIEHFTGFGLYDKSFINVMRDLNDPVPFLRGIVAELGYRIKIIPYKQNKRKKGKSKFGFSALYDTAMIGITTYTKAGLRLATFFGFIAAICSFLIGVGYLVAKLVFWNAFNAGIAPALIGVFFLGAVMLILMGVMGEYILSINQRVLHRPLVIEEERLNFELKEEDKTGEN